MDRDDVQRWLDRYVDAWTTGDPGAIGALFTVDAAYRYHPYDDADRVVRGRGAIVRAWLGDDPTGVASTPDEPGTFEAAYEPFAVDGDRAVASGVTRYWTDASHREPAGTFHNVFLLRFDADGACAEFTELFVQRPER